MAANDIKQFRTVQVLVLLQIEAALYQLNIVGRRLNTHNNAANVSAIHRYIVQVYRYTRRVYGSHINDT
jgi:hypothetical protein